MVQRSKIRRFSRAWVVAPYLGLWEIPPNAHSQDLCLLNALQVFTHLPHYFAPISLCYVLLIIPNSIKRDQFCNKCGLLWCKYWLCSFAWSRRYWILSILGKSTPSFYSSSCFHLSSSVSHSPLPPFHPRPTLICPFLNYCIVWWFTSCSY